MKKTRTVKIYKLLILVVVFLFAVISVRLSYIVLSKKVDGIDLTAFAENRNTVKEKIFAERGTIYDSLGNILSVNINSYTVIAYLEPSRTTDMSSPNHVVDKEKTAKELSKIINMSEEDILYLLNTKDVYQVELGPGGRGITELVKEQIEKLNLPGIDFIKSVKRYYPNGDFLSYTLGYAKTKEDGSVVGEMGVELEYNEELTGKNGSREYEGDIYGYKMANSKENVVPAENGDNIYLTIDTNIQLFAEQALAKIEQANLEWASISVTNAKTGEILAVASNPSFDPNTKEITSYYDPFVSYTYEPGSTMKTFSFMSAIEHGLYDEKEKYMSGSIVVDGYKISDWNTWGWGEITYDQGFFGSSNVAATKLGLRQGGKMLKDFYTSLGFGEKTGISLPNEEYGSLPFKYDIEVANASFGQGMTVTPIQMVQALTSIANEGTVLKPYIVKKVTDSKGNTVLENSRTELRTVASKKTIEKVQYLMHGAVNSEERMAASTGYRTSPVITIGKTGTAQIASPGGGGYLTGYYDYVKSFAGLFPADNPQILVYIVVSKTTDITLAQDAYKGLVQDVSAYLGITGKYVDEVKNNNVMKSYINKNTNAAKEELSRISVNAVVIGSGEVIINQYPTKGTVLNPNDKVLLLTNASDLTHVSINGFSKNDLEAYAKLVNVKFKYNGYGYVKDSNISGLPINSNETIEVNLSPIYTESKEVKNT